ncbi:MAG: hypothetical protein EYC70_10560 [Planctomycetota bacterium]|nr:MAG: hypothetical protein EYC70_10560 [Planctomycetota bacterium]
MQVRRLLAAPIAACLAACSATQLAESESAARFVQQHYGRITVGADWTQVQADFLPDARIARVRPEAPGLPETSTVAEYFARSAPHIDAQHSFSIRPMGLRAVVYDRVATVWASVEVEETSAGGQESVFAAVDVFCLARDEQDRWRISHLLWQTAVPSWPPDGERTSQPFTRDGVEVRLGFGYVGP